MSERQFSIESQKQAPHQTGVPRVDSTGSMRMKTSLLQPSERAEHGKLQTINSHVASLNKISYLKTKADQSAVASQTLATPMKQSEGIQSSYNLTQNPLLMSQIPSNENFFNGELKNASTKLITRRDNSSTKNFKLARKRMKDGSQEISNVAQKKLFAQEFYNLKKKTQRRDLVGFSLHNYPESHTDHVANRWQFNENSAADKVLRQKRISSNDSSPPPTYSTKKLRKLQHSSPQKSSFHLSRPSLGDQNQLARRELLNFAASKEISPAPHKNGMSIQTGSRVIEFNSSQDFLKFHTQTKDVLPKINKNELSQNASMVVMQSQSQLVSNALKQLNQSSDQTLYHELSKSINNEYDSVSQHDLKQHPQQAKKYVSSIMLDSTKNNKHSLQSLKQSNMPIASDIMQQHQYSRHSLQVDNITVGKGELGTSNMYSDQPASYRVKKNSARADQKSIKISQSQFSLKQLRFIQKQDQDSRVYNDLKLFKSLQNQTYGQSNTSGRPSKSTNIGSSNQLGSREQVFQRHQQFVVRTRDKSQEKLKVVRHPQLKHELSGNAFSYTQQKLDLYAQNAPLFKQEPLSKEQIEIYEKLKDIAVPVIEPTSNLAASPRRMAQIYDLTNLGVPLNHKPDSNANQSLSPGSLDSSPRPIVNGILVGVSNIKDPVGFDKKVKTKLDLMLDPQNVQILTVEKSKQLYQALKKQQDKEQERKAKWENKIKKKNKPVDHMPSQVEKKNKEAELKSASRKSFKEALSPMTKTTNKASRKLSKDSGSTASPIKLSNQSPGLRSLSPEQQRARIRAAAKQRPLHPKTQAAKDTSRPDYFAMKGRIDTEMLKDKLSRDLMQNMKMAEKMGVLAVLKDMHYDAEEKMSWKERRRAERNNGEHPLANQSSQNSLNGSQQLKISRNLSTDKGSLQQVARHQDISQFPGYSERLAQVEKEEAQKRLDQRRKEESQSVDVIGHRSEFFIGEVSNVNLPEIYQQFMIDAIKKFSVETMQEFIQRDEVVAFMSRIHDQYLKHDPGAITGQELDLSHYVKYLVGEMRNKDFVMRREDFAQKHELNVKTLKMPFEEYADQEENSMKTVANDIIQRVDYNTVIQNIYQPISIVRYREDPKFAYFQICQKDSDLAIPLLAKVVNRQLSLMNYKLSQGHMQAFCKTFDFNKEFVNSFLFKNCGISDMHNEILLNSVEKLEQVKSLVYKQEEFGNRSVQAIRPLLQRTKPHNLQVLRLIDCKIQPRVTRELISMLRESNQLRVLGLVNAKINHSSMEDIGVILAESKTIRELDVSWNELKPACYNTLIASLGENKTLLTLNLSWNRIVDSNETVIEEPIQQTIPGTRVNSISTSPRGSVSASAAAHQSELNEVPWFEKEAQFSDHSQTVVDNIIQLLKRNKNLQHVNLMKTGLTEYMLLKIARSITRAKSLVSLHLCNNPGVTTRLKDHLQTRVRCIPPEPQVKFPVSEHISEITNQATRKILKRQLTSFTEVEGEKPIARETIKIKQNLERKRIHSLVNEFAEEIGSDTRLIFTRVLGHKVDMPGSGQWKLIRDRSDECWVCDQEVYGLVFWDPELIANKAILSTRKDHQSLLLRTVVDRLHQVRSKEEEDAVARANPHSPLIMGDFTNWKPRTFRDVVEYTESISEQLDVDRIIQLMQQDKVLSYRVNSTKQFNKQDQLNFKKYMATFFEQHTPQNWKETLQKTLLYKQPHLVHASDTRVDFYKTLWMMASMFKVGKHEFIIREPAQFYDRETCEFVDCNDFESDGPHYMYYSDISDIRTEEIHPFLKAANSNKFVRVFNKEKSVFAPWKQDTKKTIEDAFQIDWGNTRIPNLVRDEGVLEELRQYMKANYEFLRAIFLELQYNSVYPFVNKIELASFCEKSKLLDDRLNMAKCDLLFVSSNVQQKGGIKQKTGLIRCEFLEYIVRLANFKYVQTGQSENMLIAVQKVIDTFIKKNITPMPWQQFRDEELWTIEVNDVFETNLDGLNKLHNFYFTPTQKFMSEKDAISLLTKDAFADLTYTQAKYCLAFSKMQLKDEIGEFDKYHKLQPVEMFEMIGRAAKVKFAHTDYEEEPLARRIELLLDMLFPLIKFHRREVIRDAESESASDDDY